MKTKAGPAKKAAVVAADVFAKRSAAAKKAWLSRERAKAKAKVEPAKKAADERSAAARKAVATMRAKRNTATKETIRVSNPGPEVSSKADPKSKQKVAAKVTQKEKPDIETLAGGFRPTSADTFKTFPGRKGPEWADPTPENQVILDSWAKKNYGKWSKSLSSEEKESIKAYTSGDHEIVNSSLREGGSISDISDTDLDRIDLIRGAIARARVPEPIVVTRGLKDLTRNGIDLDKMRPGDVFVEKAMMSTTLLANGVQGFAGTRKDHANMTIRVPAGAKGVFIDDSITSRKPDDPREYEMLFDVGTKMRIVSVSKKENGLGEIVMEMVLDA